MSTGKPDLRQSTSIRAMSNPSRSSVPLKPEALREGAPPPPDPCSARPQRCASGGVREAVLEKALITLRVVPEYILARGVHDLRRRRPEVFERLGSVAQATIEIAPSGLPIIFRLSPSDARHPVAVAGRLSDAPCAARISGPLPLLLEVLDGRSDADAAFFSRRLVVTGDTHAIVGLHNTLEAAELAPADLIGAPSILRPLANALARRGLDWINRRGVGA